MYEDEGSSVLLGLLVYEVRGFKSQREVTYHSMVVIFIDGETKL